jgi:hypothetical protein
VVRQSGLTSATQAFEHGTNRSAVRRIDEDGRLSPSIADTSRVMKVIHTRGSQSESTGLQLPQSKVAQLGPEY